MPLTPLSQQLSLYIQEEHGVVNCCLSLGSGKTFIGTNRKTKTPCSCIDKVRYSMGLYRGIYQIHKMGVKVDLYLLFFKVYQTLVKRNKTIKRLLGYAAV